MSLETESMFKVMDFYFLQKNTGKVWAKAWGVSRDKIQQQLSLRLPQRRQPKKQQKQQVIWLEIRSSRKLQKLLQRIITKIQENMLQLHKCHKQQTYLKKYAYQQKSDRKFLMNFSFSDYKYIERMEFQKVKICWKVLKTSHKNPK